MKYDFPVVLVVFVEIDGIMRSNNIHFKIAFCRNLFVCVFFHPKNSISYIWGVLVALHRWVDV